MKRLGRWLANLATAVSLVLLAATLLAWRQSFTGGMTWDRPPLQTLSGRLTIAGCSRAGKVEVVGIFSAWAHEAEVINDPNTDSWVVLLRQSGAPRESPRQNYPVSLSDYQAFVVKTQWFWTSDLVLSPSLSARGMVVSIPYWLMILLEGTVLICAKALIARRRKNSATSCCMACGYDVRATPQRCPECGAIPVPATPNQEA